MELQQQDLGLLIGSGLLSLLGPMLFLGLKVYSRSEFTPRVEQQRRVTLGCASKGLLPPHYCPRDILQWTAV